MPLKYIGIFIISMGFPAIDSVCKEKVRQRFKSLGTEPVHGPVRSCRSCHHVLLLLTVRTEIAGGGTLSHHFTC